MTGRVVTISDILDISSYRRFHHHVRVNTIELPKSVRPPSFKFKRKGIRDSLIPSSDPIVFEDYSSELLLEIWSRFSASNFDPDSLLDICPLDLKYEILKTYHALTFWEDTPGSKRYTIREVLRSSLLLGPSYAERISDEWEFGIRRFFRIPGVFRNYEGWSPVKHYNELPPVAYLIRWKESCDDIKYMNHPMEPFDEALLAELRATILENLPDELELPKDVEVLSKVKTSTTLDLDRMRTIPFYKGRLGPDGSRFSRIFKAKRSVVPVSPANTRDAVVTTIDTYNSVKWCDLVIGGILDDFEESLVTNSPQNFRKKIERMTRIPRRGEYYWLRDIKKCGLTFPRELVHMIQDCLREKYPEMNFDRFDIYRYYSVYDEFGKQLPTRRGFCLGMANNCVTFIQCMLYRMLLRRLPPHIEAEALVGNDDSCLKIWIEGEPMNEIDAMMVQDIDFSMLKGLNIISHDIKSFWSWWPIIFEEYGHQDFKSKDSRLACALSSAMLAPDIKYAKMLTSTLSLALWEKGDWIEASIRRLTSYWGYEFYPEEVKNDYLLGGWFHLVSQGCSLAARQIFEFQGDLRPLWAAIKQVDMMNKSVLRPVLEGTVTENYSVLGSMLNITYVDTELYDVPELPIEMIYLNRESYEKFYESIYRFNRNPYNVISSRLEGMITTYTEPGMEKLSLVEFILSRYTKIAIPTELVVRDTPIFEISPTSSVDCSSLMRNCLSRYIEHLRISKILTCTPLDIDASGEYPYVSKFDRSPFTEKVEKITTLDGDIPDGIYQYSTNPWIPIYEYYKSYDRIPLNILRLVPDKKHLPIWFMTKSYKDSHEVSLAYQIMDEGEFAVDQLLEDLREAHVEKSTPERAFSEEGLCYYHLRGMSPWEAADDIFNVQLETCILCILEDTLWRARKLSESGMNEKIRYQNKIDIPIIRNRIKNVIERNFPIYTAQIPGMLQETGGLMFLNACQDTDEQLLDMFGWE